MAYIWHIYIHRYGIIYIYIYICMYVYIYVNIYVCVYIYIYMAYILHIMDVETLVRFGIWHLMAPSPHV